MSMTTLQTSVMQASAADLNAIAHMIVRQVLVVLLAISASAVMSSSRSRSASPDRDDNDGEASASPSNNGHESVREIPSRSSAASSNSRKTAALHSVGASASSMSTSELVLSSRLSDCQPRDLIDSLVNLLERTDKLASADLLAAIRGTLKKREQEVSVRLGELLLQGYLRLRMRGEFDDVLAEMETSSGTGSVPSIAALAMKNSWCRVTA